MDASFFGSIPFIPGTFPKKPEPLSRYLPPVQVGVTSAWLQNNIMQGSLVLDPFGATPRIALEAAHAGYRVLVTANNPITRFLLEMMADPPMADELRGALAELSASYVGDERIEPHIRSLYNTYCARCGQIVSANSFVWEHGNPSPNTRTYSCSNCGDSGEHPCTPDDVKLSGKFSSSGPHKARALERVVGSTDQDRIHVEQALSVYIPRALYALITIINKIEGLNISPKEQRYLKALLLYAFDQANALWRVPAQKEKRRGLNIPRHFRENNVWFALEEGINLWSQANLSGQLASVPVTIWPDLPPHSGGICIYEGRFITLADSLIDMDIKSVCTALPRPNQAFWTLSALWAGWLWGREAVGSFKSVLRRQRYDWAWHTTALSSVFKQLVNSLKPSTAIFGLITEAEPGFIGSALVAAAVAGCRLESMAIRPEEDQAQVTWKCGHNRELTQIDPNIGQVAIQAAKRYLGKRAEPACYLNTIAAVFIGISNLWNSKTEDTIGEKKMIPDSIIAADIANVQKEPTPSLIYTSIYNSAREALSFRSGFLRYSLQEIFVGESANKNQIVQTSLFDINLSKSTNSDEIENPEYSTGENEPASAKERPTRSSDISESTFIWLREIDTIDHIPVTDRYELKLVDFLLNHPGCTLDDIDQALCELFPGLFTPDLEFIQLCLESYAAQDFPNANHWHIRPEDDPNERKLDIERSLRSLHQIGEALGFICNERTDNLSKLFVSWSDKNGNLDYRFYSTVSAAIGEIVLYSEQPPRQSFIVLPGSRANLLFYKLRHDSRISKAFNPSQGYWKFLKFRHLRSLSESPILNRGNLDQLLGLDPITYSTPQIWLI